MKALTDVAARPTPFSHTVQVYWEDTDGGGVVYHANYLKFFERARTEWLRSLGFSQVQLLRHDGVMFVVAASSTRHLRAARLDDVLRITVQVQAAGRASLALAQQAWRGAELVAAGDIRIGCVAAVPLDDGTFGARRIPDAVLQRMKNTDE